MIGKMTYKISKKKQRTSNFKISNKKDKLKLQSDINNLLFTANKEEYKYPKLLTIIIMKEKEHNFNFLKNETEFEVQGKWHNKKGKLYNEENAEIEIQYWDNKQDTKTNKLKTLFKTYNKKYVKEESLYATTTPLDMTTLNQKGL